MLMARYKTIIVVLLMLLFTGQVMASAKLSCQSQSSQPSEQIMPLDMVDHSQHLGLDPSLADGTAAFDCCPNCDCNLGGCTAAAVLPAVQSLFISGIVSLTSRDNELAENQLAVSLFRPPISR